jgi:hypothetical protein
LRGQEGIGESRGGKVRRWTDVPLQMHYIGHQLVMVNETSKDDRMIYRHYGYAPAGRRATIHANFVRGEHYSIVAALSMDGYEAMAVVPGSVDGESFYNFIVDNVVSFLLVIRDI